MLRKGSSILKCLSDDSTESTEANVEVNVVSGCRELTAKGLSPTVLRGLFVKKSLETA